MSSLTRSDNNRQRLALHHAQLPKILLGTKALPAEHAIDECHRRVREHVDEAPALLDDIYRRQLTRTTGTSRSRMSSFGDGCRSAGM